MVNGDAIYPRTEKNQMIKVHLFAVVSVNLQFGCVLIVEFNVLGT